MTKTYTCNVCGKSFDSTPRTPAPKFCSRACYYKSREGRDLLTPAGRKRLADLHRGDKNPARNSETAKKISEHHKASGRFVGPSHPNFKGGWKARGGNRSGQEYFFTWVPHDERAANPTTNKRGYIHRSHYVWNTAHPDDPVQPGQVVHHLNGQGLDDRPENLVKMQTQREHWKHHAAELTPKRKRNKRGQFK